MLYEYTYPKVFTITKLTLRSVTFIYAIQKLKSYFTENIIHVHYKNQLINVVREMICVCSENYIKHNTLHGKIQSFLMLWYTELSL